MDHALKSVVETAERGGPVPAVKLFTGGTMVVGFPVGSTEALDLMKPTVAEQEYRAADPKRKERDEVSQRSWLRADEMLDSFRSSLGPDFGALTLKSATVVVLSTGETIKPAGVLRVPFDAIDGWFVGLHESKAAKQGGGAFVGISVPLQNQ